MSALKKLTELAFPDLVGIEQESIEDDVIETIKSDIDYQNVFRDGELEQSANFTVIAIFSYVAKKIIQILNRNIRENFITQARTDRAVVDNLQNMRVQLQQNKSSVVEVTGVVQNNATLTRDLVISSQTRINGTGLDGASIPFEFLEIDPIDNTKFDYGNDVIVPAGSNSFKLNMYQGITRRVDTILQPPADSQKFIYTISDPDVIDGSIRVFSFFGNGVRQTECILTDSLVVEPVPSSEYPDGVPHYTVKSFTNGSVQLIFGTDTFGGSFSKTENTPLTIWYRVGGGVNGNVTIGSINQNITFNPGAINEVTINFQNLSSGSGGGDRENINEAKFYAPFRAARGKSIVDDTDALMELRSQIVKHKIYSPKYSELDNTINLLHYHNLIAPKRDFNNFSFPSVNAGDTLEEYNARFLDALNEFLNLDKIHDGQINDELMSLFVDSDFSYNLDLRNPLNGTLYISAYDHNNIEKDRLYFTGNYINTVTSDGPTDKATATGNNTVGVTTIDSSNDTLSILMDDPVINGGPGTGVVYTITIPHALYGLTDGINQDLADAIDTAIKAEASYFSNFAGHSFCTANEDGTISIVSGTVGQYSLIKLFDVGASIYGSIGFDGSQIPAVIRAQPSSGLVFLSTSELVIGDDTTDTIINTKLNTDRMSREIEYDPLLTAWPDTASATGPDYSLVLEEEDGDRSVLQLTKTLNVKAYTSGDVLIDEIDFNSVAETDTNTAILGTSGTGDVFDIASPLTNFDYLTSTLGLKLVDSQDASAPYDFPTGYTTGTYFVISFQEKTYKFTTTTYTPNPYYQEGEAKILMDRLRATGKRQMGVEPIPKKVDFIPTKLIILLETARGSSRSKAILDCKSIVQDVFGYDNDNENSIMSGGLNIKDIEAKMNDSNRSGAIGSAEITNHSSNIIDTVGNKYYFALPESVINRLEELESINTNIQGMASLYSIDVIASN